MAPNVLLFEVTLLKPIAQSKECREEEQVASFFQAYSGLVLARADIFNTGLSS